MRPVCSEPDCAVKVHARGLCHPHYLKRRRNGTLGAHALADPAQSHPRNPDYDVSVRVVDLRLAVEMARSRVAQALIVMRTPEVGALKNVSAGELLDEALGVLDAIAADRN